jgi:hypothetical protein
LFFSNEITSSNEAMKYGGGGSIGLAGGIKARDDVAVYDFSAALSWFF